MDGPGAVAAAAAVTVVAVVVREGGDPEEDEEEEVKVEGEGVEEEQERDGFRPLLLRLVVKAARLREAKRILELPCLPPSPLQRDHDSSFLPCTPCSERWKLK